MNRLELAREIKKEGLRRGIKVTECAIYDRGDYIDFYPRIENNYADKWIYPHQVEELISDFAPIERPHKVAKIDLDNVKDLIVQNGVIVFDDISPDGMNLLPVWEEFKQKYSSEFTFNQDMNGKGIGWAIKN